MTPDPLPVSRRIALAEPAGAVSLAAEGLLGLTVEAGGRSVRVRYDLRLLGLAEVVALLRGAGLVPSRRPWARLARFWAEFHDDNLRQQARIVHRCCSTPPAP